MTPRSVPGRCLSQKGQPVPNGNIRIVPQPTLRVKNGKGYDEMKIGLEFVARNKELMRIFRDLELVESLGSGMGYIMRKYGRDNFIFLDNFIRITVPYITKDREGQTITTEQVTVQVAAATV